MELAVAGVHKNGLRLFALTDVCFKRASRHERLSIKYIFDLALFLVFWYER
jgi:hypothetical protein